VVFPISARPSDVACSAHKISTPVARSVMMERFVMGNPSLHLDEGATIKNDRHGPTDKEMRLS